MNLYAQTDYRGYPALNYLRVSDTSQTVRGTGLESQNAVNREYANRIGCNIVKTFKDDITGGKASRDGMDGLILYLKTHRKAGPYLVIIDDLSRLARDVIIYWDLREAIKNAGGILVSPSMVFNDDAAGRHYQNNLANNAEYQRLRNAEQTYDRMRGRLLNGYWPFSQPPIGYKNVRIKGEGSTLQRDEPLASIVAEALKGFASGRFETQAEVKRFLESVPAFPKTRKGIVTNQRVKDILTQPLYAGLVGHERWKVSLREGKHKEHHALITLEEYQKIQDRLNGKAKAPARKDISKDFPLRGSVVCGDCGTPLTSCWTKGNTKRYAYYLCPKKGCESYGKSIKRDVLEGEFEAMLASMTPSPELIKFIRVALRDIWDHNIKYAESIVASAKAKQVALERQIDKLVDKIVDVSNPRVMEKIECRIDELEREKLVMQEKAAKSPVPERSFEDAVRTSVEFLSNPQKLWASGDIHHKKTLLRLMLEHRLEYVRNKGLRTPQTSLPFRVIGGLQGKNIGMAHRGGFEPPTPRFVV